MAAVAVATLDASSSKFFQTATQADFLKGDLDGLSIPNEDIHQLLDVDPNIWFDEAEAQRAFFQRFGDRLDRQHFLAQPDPLFCHAAELRNKAGTTSTKNSDNTIRIFLDEYRLELR